MPKTQTNIWEKYVERALSNKEIAKDMIKIVVLTNENDIKTIELLRKKLNNHPELLNYLEKLLLLT
jgi:hypothetical protein